MNNEVQQVGSQLSDSIPTEPQPRVHEMNQYLDDALTEHGQPEQAGNPLKPTTTTTHHSLPRPRPLESKPASLSTDENLTREITHLAETSTLAGNNNSNISAAVRRWLAETDYEQPWDNLAAVAKGRDDEATISPVVDEGKRSKKMKSSPASIGSHEASKDENNNNSHNNCSNKVQVDGSQAPTHEV